MQAVRFSDIDIFIEKIIMKRLKALAFTAVILLISVADFTTDAQKTGEKGVKLVELKAQNRIDVYIDGRMFTSFQYPDNIEKTFLYPVNAPDGNVITRGYPIEPRKGERVDHPHHIGIWFNHGNVNGLDFWNNSSAIEASKKGEYGHIVHRLTNIVAGGKRGIIEVILDWKDNSGNIILTETARYIFTGDKNSATIDHVSSLTAVNGPVTFGDSKEGLFAIRVDRAFEMPSDEPLTFTDEKGNTTTVKATDNTGVTGMYTSETGLKGDAVWGTRNKWVILTGTKNSDVVSMAMFDHPKNPGYPAYAHARGYGLFSINNFGRNSYDPKQEKTSFTIETGKSVTLMHRFYVQSGSELTNQKAEKIFRSFEKLY